MHKFTYHNDSQNPDSGIELECSKEDLIQAAKKVFVEWVEADGIAEAIYTISGNFWQEGELNAAHTLMGNGDFLGYAIENCSFLEHDAVLDKAQDNAIARHTSRMEGDE